MARIFHVFIDLYTTKKKEITFRKTFHAIKLRLSWQKNISLASLHNHSVFIWKNCSIVRGRSYKTWFSRTMCTFSIIFLCRRMFVTIVLMSCIFYSISHMSTTLWCMLLNFFRRGRAKLTLTVWSRDAVATRACGPIRPQWMSVMGREWRERMWRGSGVQDESNWTTLKHNTQFFISLPLWSLYYKRHAQDNNNYSWEPSIISHICVMMS